MSHPKPTDAGGHYGRVMKRLTDLHGAWAGAIHVLTLFAVLPRVRDAIAVVAVAALLTPLNMWITRWILPRLGPVRAEIVRMCVNLGLGLALYHATSWPLPVWLWLPYIALGYDTSHRRVASWVLATTWIGMTVVAAYDGVSIFIPASSGVAAFMCRMFAEQRLRIIREMFETSERRRLELDAAHERLKDEVAARERAEEDLRRAQKLEAVGRIASRVAHEINNPLQYVSNSLSFIEDNVGVLEKLLATWRSRMADVEPRVRVDMLRAEAAANLDHVRADLRESIEMSREGVKRVTAVVHAMNELARTDGDDSTGPRMTKELVQALIEVGNLAAKSPARAN